MAIPASSLKQRNALCSRALDTRSLGDLFELLAEELDRFPDPDLPPTIRVSGNQLGPAIGEETHAPVTLLAENRELALFGMYRTQSPESENWRKAIAIDENF